MSDLALKAMRPAECTRLRKTPERYIGDSRLLSSCWGLTENYLSGRVQLPDLPPDFASNLTPVIDMPRSTALHIS